MTRVAVVGTGFGGRVHVPALRAAGFDVVALVGRDSDRTERRAARLGVATACASLADAVRLGIDAVTIATPPATHAPLTIQALDEGLHVLCEKPFALDAAEAERMCVAASDAGCVGLIAHEFRFAPERAHVARLLRGAVGEPRLAMFVQHLALVADRSSAMPSWWYDASRGGGWLLASGSHLVDQVRHWLGDVAEVRSGALLHRDADADDAFTAHLTTTSGCEVTLVQMASSWGPAGGITRVIGDRGSIWIDHERSVWVADAEHPDGRRVFEPPSVPPSDDPRQRFTHLEIGPFTDLCRQFDIAISTGDTGDAATFADGVAAQRVMDRIREVGQGRSHRPGG